MMIPPDTSFEDGFFLKCSPHAPFPARCSIHISSIFSYKEVMRRSRTTRHETLGDAALFSFSVRVSDEIYKPIDAIALARHVTSAIASGTRRWWAGVPALPRGSAAAGPARRGWGSARLDLTAHPGRMPLPQRVQAPWRARSRPGYTHSPPGCSRSPYWHALSGWLPASQQRPAALPVA